MISRILGKIIYKDEKKIILDKSGIGFEVFLAPGNLKALSLNEEKDIYTFLFLGEKVMELYGFLTIKELELFKVLKGVSGVGPKTALSLAVLGSLENLKDVLEKGEMPMGIKGVGAKKLQKILLEITGEIEKAGKASPSKKATKDQVFDTLATLGFARQDITDVLSRIPKDKSAEERIKEALKLLAK